MVIEVEALLREVLPSCPTGDNLEYDPTFASLERAAQGKPEQQIGATVVPAEDPDWPAIEKICVELFARSKDLRVAVLLTRALVHRSGWLGLSSGLEVIRGLLERYWDGVHPQLDPDDDHDPTLRNNTLVGLCDSGMLQAVRCAPLVRSRAFGSVGLREVALATNQNAPPSDRPSITPASVHAAFDDAPAEEVELTRGAVQQAREHLSAIEVVFAERCGGQGPVLERLRQLVSQAERAMQDHVPSAMLASSPDSQEAAGFAGDIPVAAKQAGPSRTGPREISSRQDVLDAIDQICVYFERCEPSSPVPFMLRRCKRLVNSNFVDILRDMAPDALSQIENILGKPEE